MDFHHLEPEHKDFSISKLKGTTFNEIISKELDKCILVCCRCHREIHADLRSSQNWSSKVRTPLQMKGRTWKNGYVVGNRKVVSKRIVNNFCIDCGIKISQKSTRCRKCIPRKYKIIWPKIDELILMVEKSNYCAVGRILGVSDNAIRKRIKSRLDK